MFSWCELDKPDFKLIVDRTIAVFAVYTGATLSFFVKDFLPSEKNLSNNADVFAWAANWRSWVVIAVIALLLRYIVGSAVQLNRAYVPKEDLKIGTDGVITATKTYKSASVCWLFFDVLFLIGFGVLAFFLTTGASVEGFLWRSIYFTTGGFLWSLIAALFRSGERKVACLWLVLDGAQIAITLFLVCLSWGDLAKSMALAIFYLVFLFIDFYVLARTA